MNIFFSSASKISDPELSDIVGKDMPAFLKSLGHDVFVYKYNPDVNNGFSTFQEINDKINKADVYIGEMSKASQSLGFQLSYALSLLKPCLYLYHESRSGEPDRLMTENPSRLLRIKTYNNKNYKRVLEKFIKSSQKQLPSRRTSFMSTNYIDEFVSRFASQNGISKGEVIRQILDAEAKKRLKL